MLSQNLVLEASLLEKNIEMWKYADSVYHRNHRKRKRPYMLYKFLPMYSKCKSSSKCFTFVELWNLFEIFDQFSCATPDAVAKFGSSCHLPGSFQSPLHCIMTMDDYQEAIRKNIMAGGDSASRAHLIGAMLAAQDGLESVPKEWREKTTRYRELEVMADRLISQRSLW